MIVTTVTSEWHSFNNKVNQILKNKLFYNRTWNMHSKIKKIAEGKEVYNFMWENSI